MTRAVQKARTVLTFEQRKELMKDLQMKLELSTKKLCAKYCVSRSTIFVMTQALKAAPDGTAQIVHKPLKTLSEADLNELAAVFARLR